MRSGLIGRAVVSALIVVALAGAAPVAASSRSAVRASAAVVVPATPCVSGHSSACPIRITFASGAYSGQAHSTMTSITSTRWFVVNLRGNQYVIVWVIGKGSTRGTIYFPGGGGEGQPGGRIYDGHAPRSGDYKIRVTESQMGEEWSGRVDVLVVAM